MDNLQPVQRKPTKAKPIQKEEFGKGFLGPLVPVEPKPKKQILGNRIGLSALQGQLLAIGVIALALVVVLMSFWIGRLIYQRQDKELIIKNLGTKISNLEKIVQDNEMVMSASPSAAYRPIPSEISPTVSPGIDNPDIARKESFEYERFFKNSEILITENKPLSFYICNDQAALRLIRDSQLPYLLSTYSEKEYCLVLGGNYEPSWVVQLDNLQKLRREFMNRLITLSASPTASGTPTAVPSIPAIPEELDGLEIRRVYTLYNIQVLADASLEKLKTQVGILRNENIPAFIYGYVNPGRSYMYSLRIGIFPTDSDAKQYSDQMNRVTYRELIHKEIDDRFIRKLSLE